MSDEVARSLLAKRVVLLHGELDDAAAAEAAACDTTAGGTVPGGAVGVLAAGRHRTLAPHARLHLKEPDIAVEGRAAEIERALAAQAAHRDRFFARIAACTGRPQVVVEEGWLTGRHLEPADAMALGYADALEGT